MAPESLAGFGDVPLDIFAVVPAPRMRLGDVASLKPGSVVATAMLADGKLVLHAVNAPIATAALYRTAGRICARVTEVGGER